MKKTTGMMTLIIDCLTIASASGQRALVLVITS
jgi:hypothetical protein